MIPPPSYAPSGGSGPGPTPNAANSPGGAAPWPSPLTYAEGQLRVQAARAYAWAAIDKACSGSVCPPASAIAPELVRLIKELDVVRDGFDAMVRRGAGKATMPDKLRVIAQQRAHAVVWEADRLVGAVMEEDRRNREKLSFGGDVLKWGLIVAGIGAAALLVSHVASTARNVRLTVRGYPS